ncbi:uncharacterized protein LOC114762602 [Neltuma alba]|uniref:uncharacterized protein LOC114744589 n=1 Tax=Neltuma alba TaxID=207710 RepID=UPI0010A48370|nr:uncharacterized protein LOC114744589 [Prosopis alba]XP_028807944.1 uncharacterized protein LOC114762602 [Prosopis alba]
MPFHTKVQPIDSSIPAEGPGLDQVKPVVKSRLKRLFERQFPGVLKNSAADKIAGDEPHFGKDGFNASSDFEPNSLCLAKMVQNFIEDNQEKHSTSVRCVRNRCNCFNGNCEDCPDDDGDAFGDSKYSSNGEASGVLKGLVACASVCERNLLADTAKIVEKNKICKRRDGLCRKIVTDELLALGYDASICKSRWEKSPLHLAGEYEYIDVIIENERVIIDIDFRSEFEIARSTKSYKAILQTLPYIFVGKSDRLQSIIAIVSDAAKQSLKKTGMHIPPWRKAEYVKAKWLSPHTRVTPPVLCLQEIGETREKQEALMGNSAGGKSDGSALVFSKGSSGQDEKGKEVMEWKPPDVIHLKPKISGFKVVTGLSAVLDERP